MDQEPVPELKTAFARQRRRMPSRIEKALWRELRAKRLDGCTFRREAPIGPYVADFACFEARLIVEADGPLHASTEARLADARRDAWFEGAKFRVLRFTEDEILGDLGRVLDRIRPALRPTSPFPDRLRRPPSPSRGEGVLAPVAELSSGPDNGGEPRRVLVIACGALAREVRAVLAANRLYHVDLTCLPAILHNRPEKIPEAVRAAVREYRDRYDRIAVAYADCGTGGLLDRVCEEEGVSRIVGPHCYAFFSGTEAFLARDDADMDAFFLTDFLARQFDAFVVEPLGLDRHPELRDMYFGNYRRLIYLAQTEDAELDAKAQAAATRLGLSYEKRITGLGDLATFIGRFAEPPAPRESSS